MYCPPSGGACIVVVETPGGSGDDGDDGSGGSSRGACYYRTNPVPCYLENLGWFNPQDECYYREMEPQPPAGDPLWEGHDPEEGRVYLLACYPDLKPRGGTVFLTDPPPGYGALPSPAQLAAEAINRLPITGPDIGIAPDPDGSGLVGLPVWMWTAVTPTTWGPVSATAAVPGLSVTATAHAERIVWSMGAGQPSVTCANPGTRHTGQSGPSPTCGFDSGYAMPGRYTVTGTTAWQVDWAGGGESGSLTVTRQSSTAITIGELQVVTR